MKDAEKRRQAEEAEENESVDVTPSITSNPETPGNMPPVGTKIPAESPTETGNAVSGIGQEKLRTVTSPRSRERRTSNRSDDWTKHPNMAPLQEELDNSDLDGLSGGENSGTCDHVTSDTLMARVNGIKL